MDATEFTILAGADAAAAYEALVATIAVPSKRIAGCWESESLCRAQAEARSNGFEAAELVPTLFGWSVREASFDKRVLAGTRRGEPLDGTYAGAAERARSWVAARADRRWAFTRVPDMRSSST